MEPYLIVLLLVLQIVLLISTISSSISNHKRFFEIESKFRYHEMLIKEINKALPTEESIERLVGRLIVRAERRTIIEKKNGNS